MRARAGVPKTSNATVNKWWRAYACADAAEFGDHCGFNWSVTGSIEELRRRFGLYAAAVDRVRLALDSADPGLGAGVLDLWLWEGQDERELLVNDIGQLGEALRWARRGASSRSLRRLARQRLVSFARANSRSEAEIREAIDAALVEGGVK